MWNQELDTKLVVPVGVGGKIGWGYNLRWEHIMIVDNNPTYYTKPQVSKADQTINTKPKTLHKAPKEYTRLRNIRHGPKYSTQVPTTVNNR